MNKLKEANANSFPAQRWLFEVYETPHKEMSYGVKTVAGVIALCAWGQKDTAFPSYDAISAAIGGGSRATISDALKKLTDMGFLSVSKVKTQAGLRNNYRLVFPNTLEANSSVSNSSVSEAISSVSEAISSVSGVNQFSFDGQSVHTGELEALIETPKETTIETSNDMGWIKENAIEGIQHLFPLDSEASDARDEHTWIEKAHQRQKDINEEFRKELGVSA